MVSKLIKTLVLFVARTFGTTIRDCRTGAALGRGLMFSWRGKVHLIGVQAALVPVPLPQVRVTYWHQAVGFTKHPPLAFPSKVETTLETTLETPSPKDLLVLLDHRSPSAIRDTLLVWQAAGVAPEDILLVYGGPSTTFESLSFSNKIQIQDPRLRTKDHQRERQSYDEIFLQVNEWLRGKNYTHILFHEYDHLPLVPDLLARLHHVAQTEVADVLGYHVGRIDASTHPHWLAAVQDSYEQPVCLSMLGTGHFWNRSAWEAVVVSDVVADWYLELALPTRALRAGYHVACIPSQGEYVQAAPGKRPCMKDAVSSGAWTLHPVKTQDDFQEVLNHWNR